jgi:hypothetical protein
MDTLKRRNERAASYSYRVWRRREQRKDAFVERFALGAIAFFVFAVSLLGR